MFSRSENPDWGHPQFKFELHNHAVKVPGESFAGDANPTEGENMSDTAVISEMLRTARTIAVVGMSDKASRASYNIGRYLAGHGYRVLPVNPALTSVAGMACYPDL